MHALVVEEHERHLWPQLMPPLLFVAGLATMVAATGGDAWPLSFAWAGAGAVFTLVWRRLQSRRARLVVGFVVAAVLVVLTWVGGLFVLPALLAAVVLSLSSRP